ncbi:MAG: hypothetical protein AAB564_00380 [Patescibacteria group bacterium]
MSTALSFYLLAFFSAETYRKTHIFFAAGGFLLDLYATYLMETKYIWTGFIPKTNYQFILHSHTVISILAIAAFLAQMTLGMCRKKEAHIFSAKYIFMPIWIAAYASGLYLLSIFQ